MTNLLILSLFALFSLSLILYYLVIFKKLSHHRSEKTAEDIPVSVIIAARNEYKMLKKNLPAILEQDYPDFEVVVVNDSSHDGSKTLLKELKLEYPKLKIVELNIDERYHKGKKFALTMGIKAAQNERLLFTDADCSPSSKHWIREMMEHREDKAIILGHGPLLSKNSMLGAFVYYDTFHTALQYFSYALRGMAYMSVGRNFSYTKSLFFENKGFASHQHILSGDDDLFLQQAARPDNVSICISPESFMWSPGAGNLSYWIRQKMRHVSTAKYYKPKFKGLLAWYSASQILCYVLLIINIFIPENRIAAAIIMVLKWITQYWVFLKPCKTLKYKRILYFLPFYDFWYTLVLIFIACIKPFYRVRSWS